MLVQSGTGSFFANLAQFACAFSPRQLSNALGRNEGSSLPKNTVMTNLIKYLILSVIVSLAFAAPGAADEIAWAKDWESARKAASESKKLILAEFVIDDCSYCEKLEAEVYTAPKIIKMLKDFIPVKLNAEKEAQEMADRLASSNTPRSCFTMRTAICISKAGEGGKPDLEKAIRLFKKGDAAAKNSKDSVLCEDLASLLPLCEWR
jgi:hypothetical protein